MYKGFVELLGNVYISQDSISRVIGKVANECKIKGAYMIDQNVVEDDLPVLIKRSKYVILMENIEISKEEHYVQLIENTIVNGFNHTITKEICRKFFQKCGSGIKIENLTFNCPQCLIHKS